MLLRHVAFRDVHQPRRPHEDVDAGGEDSQRDDAQQEVEVQHILKSIPAPTRWPNFHRFGVPTAHLPRHNA